jgi:hypothetical protein
MNLNTLSGALRIENGLLTIDPADLGAPHLSGLFAHLLDGPLVLSNVQPFTPSGERLEIRATGASVPFTGMAIELAFYNSPGDLLQLELTATRRESWTLADDFPAIKDTDWASLIFVPVSGEPAATFTLRTEDTPQRARGLWLAGHASSALFPPLFLAGLSAQAKIEGPFRVARLEDRLPGFALRLAVALPQPLQLALDRFLVELRLTPSFSTEWRTWGLESTTVVRADLVWENRIRVPLSAELRGDNSSYFIFRADLSEALTAGLGALKDLIGSTVPLPRELPVTDLVKVSELELHVDASSGSPVLARVSATFQTSDELHFDVITGLLLLDAIDLEVVVERPFADDVETRLTIRGLVQVGKRGVVLLSSSVEREDGAWKPKFFGTLVESSRIDLRELFVYFTGFEKHDLPELEIDQLDFEAEPATQSYQGSLELAGNWRFGGPLPVDLEAVEVSFQNIGEASIEATVTGILRFGETHVYLTAIRDTEHGGWLFRGATVADRPVGEGATLDSLVPQVSALPSMVRGLELRALGAEYNTATQDFAFIGAVAFPTDGQASSTEVAELILRVALEHAAGGGTHTEIGGKLLLHERELSMSFDRRGTRELLVASYAGQNAEPIELKKLIAPISAQLANVVPGGLSVDLQRLQLAFLKEGNTNRFLFGVELGAGIDLGKLPLVGSALTGRSISVAIQLLLTRDRFSVEEMQSINALSSPGATDFPAQAIDGMQRLLQAHSALRIVDQTHTIELGLEPDVAAPVTSGVPFKAPAGANIKWFAVQRELGPIHFERAGIGLSSDNQKLELLIDASIELAGLTLSLEGLGADLLLTELSRGNVSAEFHLDGLGIDLQRGGLEIGGALLRRPVPGGEDAYDGAIVVHYGQLGISGVGSYTRVNGHPSLIAYAQADYPLGGPPFFFVEGLALGFGYNRSFEPPVLEDIESFPLVELAVGTGRPGTPADIAARLGTHLKPVEGEYFVAAGIKFTTFKNIEGFVLLSVAFGERFEVDVIGLATLSAPPLAKDGEQLMKARLGIVARYRPEEQVLEVRGGLMPDAFLFSRNCHLAGGFAFSSWFKTGDFVLTLGGYHPKFAVPAHYPKAPRLELSWQVTPELSIKADAYFAMTHAAFMAGGHLRVNYLSGDLHAWFNAGVDCLIAWLPHHYEAKAELSIGATYETWFHTFSVQLSAKLEVWGPEFSGLAHVDWYIFSFDIAFGGTTKEDVPAVDWAHFRGALLPDKDDVLTIVASSGRTPQPASANAKPTNARKHLGVVNARELALRIGSAIPIKSGTVLGAQLDDGQQHVGIAPMGKHDGEWSSELKVSITHEGGDANRYFERVAVTEPDLVPAALWSETKKVAPGAPSVRALTHTVLRVRPAPATPNAAPGVPRAPRQKRLAAHRASTFVAENVDKAPQRMASSVQDPAVRRARRAMLAGLLPNVETTWSEKTISLFRDGPRWMKKQ